MSRANESFPRPIKQRFTRGDLDRRASAAQVKRDPPTMAIHRRIVKRDFHTVCITTLCMENVAGCRKMHVGMATGRDKAHVATEHPAAEAAVA